ncbi:hypothetical protein [Mycolicibacterium goodii]|uniref:hypothetical protein n=1 Tax=Mycolicibacterium goodii TaxID=134601 RepID=UPI0012FFAD39
MSLANRGRAATIVFALVLAVTVSGCDLSTPAEPSHTTSDRMENQSFQWTASSGISVTEGLAVPIRAYLESWSVVQSSGTLDSAYPGFGSAIDNHSDSEPSIFERLLKPDAPGHAPEITTVGNRRYLISSIDQTDGQLTALVCDYRYGLANQNPNGTFSSVAEKTNKDIGIDAYLIRLKAPDGGHSLHPLPPQEGPASRPAVDVFAGWEVTGFLNRFLEYDSQFHQVWPTYRQDAQFCVDMAPDSPDRQDFLRTGEHPRTDFPTGPLVPGWPDGRSQ